MMTPAWVRRGGGGGRVRILCVRGLESIGSAYASTAGGEKGMKENGTRNTNSSVAAIIR